MRTISGLPCAHGPMVWQDFLCLGLSVTQVSTKIQAGGKPPLNTSVSVAVVDKIILDDVVKELERIKVRKAPKTQQHSMPSLQVLK